MTGSGDHPGLGSGEAWSQIAIIVGVFGVALSGEEEDGQVEGLKVRFEGGQLPRAEFFEDSDPGFGIGLGGSMHCGLPLGFRQVIPPAEKRLVFPLCKKKGRSLVLEDPDPLAVHLKTFKAFFALLQTEMAADEEDGSKTGAPIPDEVVEEHSPAKGVADRMNTVLRRPPGEGVPSGGDGLQHLFQSRRAGIHGRIPMSGQVGTMPAFGRRGSIPEVMEILARSSKAVKSENGGGGRFQGKSGLDGGAFNLHGLEGAVGAVGINRFD